MSKVSRLDMQADAAKAAADAASAFEAQLAKTERLRALRLARDEADAKKLAEEKPAPKPARKVRRATTQR